MLEKLTIIELETYLRLCERMMDFLGMKRKLLRADAQIINQDYDYMLSLRTKLYNEISKRLKNLTLTNNAETNKETV